METNVREPVEAARAEIGRTNYANRVTGYRAVRYLVPWIHDLSEHLSQRVRFFYVVRLCRI